MTAANPPETTRVRLIHWNAAEAEERATTLRAAGYDVDHTSFEGPPSLRALRENPPAALVIDLSRIPSHGRDLALAVRESKATRHVPIVFIGGDPEEIDRVRTLLPDAMFTPWSRIRSALKSAIARPPVDPVIPESRLAGYSGTPLPKKLGIKPGYAVGLLASPEGFEKTLGPLPEGVTLRERPPRPCDLMLWFVRSRLELEKDVARAARLAGEGGLWIVWPKKTSGVPAQLTQADVREVGLASGLVDYKVCAVDEIWSGLRFARRKSR